MNFRVEAVWFQVHRSSTCGFVIWFLPVKNDEWGAALHGNHGEVRRRDMRRTGYVQIIAFFVGEVSEGGGDGARLLWLLICLVDDMRSCGRPCQKSLGYSSISSTLFNLFKLTYEAFPPCDVHFWCRWRAENGGVLAYVEIGDCKRKQVRGGVVRFISWIWQLSPSSGQSAGSQTEALACARSQTLLASW